MFSFEQINVVFVVFQVKTKNAIYKNQLHFIGLVLFHLIFREKPVFDQKSDKYLYPMRDEEKIMDQKFPKIIFEKLESELELESNEEKEKHNLDPIKANQKELIFNDEKRQLTKLELSHCERVVDRVFMAFGKDAPSLILLIRVIKINDN